MEGETKLYWTEAEKSDLSSVNKQQLFLNLMFIWCRLDTFDDLLIPFHHHIILSHSFLLSLSQRGQRYTINRSVLLMVSSACATVRLITLNAGVLERPVLPATHLINHTLGASSASARVRTWQKRPGRMERIHVITLQLWARLNSEIKSLKTHFLS